MYSLTCSCNTCREDAIIASGNGLTSSDRNYIIYANFDILMYVLFIPGVGTHEDLNKITDVADVFKAFHRKKCLYVDLNFRGLCSQRSSSRMTSNK